MEELKYVIEDSTIAELLGVQNFSTDEAAILELVKNAYDARQTIFLTIINIPLNYRNQDVSIATGIL